MLDNEFRKQRALLVCELAEKTTDPFIKRRLFALVARYDGGVIARTPTTPVDLKFRNQATGSER